MPRPVTPRKIERPWGIRWRIHYPLLLTGGRKKQRDFETKTEAQREADRVNLALKAKLEGYARFNLPERALIATHIDTLPRGLADLPKAVELFHIYHTKETRIITDLVQECLDDKKRAGLSKSYLRVLGDNLRDFADTFGKREAHTITGREVGSWVYERRDWSDYTKRNALINLGTMFSYAVAHKYIAANPVSAVERIKISLGDRCILTVDEAERLMRSIERNDPGLIPIVALVLFGGLRPEEAKRCRWHFVKDVIDLPAGETKNNKRRLIELGQLDTLRAWLEKKGDMPPNNIQRRMNRVRLLSCVGEQGPCLPVKWGHDILRHSFVSYAVPIHGKTQAALMADHSEAVLEQHYRALVTRADAERFWRIIPN